MGGILAAAEVPLAPPKYPYVFHRVFLCGHPDEYIEVTRSENDNRPLHTIVSRDAELCADLQESQLEYTLERCWKCAVERCDYEELARRNGKKATLRSTATYQGEVLQLHSADSKDGKDGFGAALKRLIPMNWFEEHREESWRMFKNLVDSVYGKAGNPVSGIDSNERHSPVDGNSKRPLLLTENDVGFDFDLPVYGGMIEDRLRKDSAAESIQIPRTGPYNELWKHAQPLEQQLVQVQEKQECGDKIRNSKRSASSLFGSVGELDWTTFCILVCNNKLSFDEIVSHVMRSIADEKVRTSFAVVESGRLHHTSELDANHFLDGVLRSSKVEPGQVKLLIDQHVRITADEASCSLPNVDLSLPKHDNRTSNGATTRDLKVDDPYDHDVINAHASEKGEQNKKRGDAAVPQVSDNVIQCEEEPHDARQSRHMSQSWFSSDSSVASIDCAPNGDSAFTKAAKAFWKPKRKKRTVQRTTSTLASVAHPRESAMSLWRRISDNAPRETASQDKELMEEVARKLQQKRVRFNDAKPQTFGDRTLRSKGRSRLPVPIVRRPCIEPIKPALRTPKHISNITPAHEIGSDHGTPLSVDRKTCAKPPNVVAVKQRGSHRPVKPSPLGLHQYSPRGSTLPAHRSPILNINKGLPPLPFSRRPAHQMSDVNIKGIGTAKRVAMQRIVNEYVGEMAKAY